MNRASRMLPVAVLAVSWMGTGCATVNPAPDYERTARHVAQATGVDALYEPGQQDVISAKVETLLTDGLTVDEAVQVALLNNPRLQAAFMDLGMARADVVQSKLLSNPTLGVTLRLPAGGGLANLEAGIAQNIAELWQIPMRARASERALDGAVLALARTAAQLAAQTKAAYYRAVGAQDRHRILDENLGIAKDLLDLAKMRQQAGAGTELDVNLSRTVVIEAELAVRSSRLKEADARRALATLLGIWQSPDDLTLLSPLLETPPEIPDAQALIEVARRSRLDLQAARQAVSSALAKLELENSRVWRTVEVGLSLERGERKRQGGRDLLADTARASIANGGLTVPNIQPRSARDRDTDFIIGPSLSLELPIFDQNQAQIARAGYAYQQAVHVLDALDRQAAQEIRAAVDQSATAWELVKIYRDRSLPLAQSNLELSREAYQAGRASFLSVLEAQRFFLTSRQRFVEAAEIAAITIPTLERTVGLPWHELLKYSHGEATSNPGNGEIP